MFPYLRTADEFLEDCKETGYGINDTGAGYEIMQSTLSGCQYVDDRDKDAFHDSSAPDFMNCRKCEKMPRLVGWLTQRVNHANWGEDLGKNGVGNVQFSEIAAWCQSVCKHMRLVINEVEKETREKLCIGIEYYLENSFEIEGTGTRLDMMIGGWGYGKDEDNKPIITEPVMKIIVDTYTQLMLSVADKQEPIQNLRAYVLGNWAAVRRTLHNKKVGGCSAE
ncbi:MAG: hypothetical protein K6F73_03035, partial [Lachnospiraceae bacterium]|nr:hypothetical protein [Lachnospiraceae bacterium]